MAHLDYGIPKTKGDGAIMRSHSNSEHQKPLEKYTRIWYLS